MDRLSKIWTLNSAVPEAVAECLHEAIASNATRFPNKLAVHAWDGDMTYGELDNLSTQLSYSLSKAGVGPEVTVPLFFEKSMWTVVSVVGVLKAGGAFALVDMGLPKTRLRAIVEGCEAKTVCSSAMNAELCLELAPNVLVVAADSQDLQPSPLYSDHQQPTPNPSWPMYVCFTSGSTGKPKGIVHTHTSFYTAFHHQAHLLGFNSSTRTYDFASYSFDVAVHNVMTTLAIGGCLCIPSDTDRKTNLNQSIRDMKANIVNLTATVTRLLRPEMLPELKTLLLLGEAVNASDIERLWGHFTIINTYGPAECTPISTINLNATTPALATGIGIGEGVNTWVVDPGDHQNLTPYGEVGELLLEGHVLARGYLHDEEKTAAAFIEDAAWLLQGTDTHLGRPGRLYKTGDLVRYNEDGSLHFIGRKDTQVKVRGQRLELGEVEHHVGKCISAATQVVAEVITPGGQGDKAMLVAFLSATEEENNERGAEIYEHASEIASGIQLLRLRASVSQALRECLPTYMVPAAYFWMSNIPQTPSAKTDRKRLREIGSGFSTQQLAQAQTDATCEKLEPRTETEKRLRDIWSEVIDLAPENIGLDDSFFLLGGDSVAAMRLVADARKVGFEVSVAEIFQHPRLVDLAKILRNASDDGVGGEPMDPFSLVVDDAEAVPQLCEELAALCHSKVNPSLIKDAYTSTSLQQGLLSLSSKPSGDKYTLRAVLELSEHVDIGVFKAAWEAVVLALPILRTRLVHHPKYGPLQVVIEESIQWSISRNLDQYLNNDKESVMAFGDSLARFALVDGTSLPQPQYFVWTLHHALYDGWSVPLILRQVSESYRTLCGRSQSISTTSPSNSVGFNVFIRHLVEAEKQSANAEAYWRSYCSDGEMASFPTLPASVTEPAPDKSIELSLAVKSNTNITMSTLLRGALSILISNYTGSLDVVFGATVSGRNAPVANIDEIIGPTIATVPIRSRIQKDQTVQGFLELLQNQAADMISYEQTSLQRIGKISDSCRLACGFQTLLVVQPEENDLQDDELIGKWQASSIREFTTYAITLECLLRPDGLKIRAGYDDNVITSQQMHAVLQHFASILKQLANASNDQTIQEIDNVTAEDNDTLWTWNSALPEPIEKTIHHLIYEQTKARPEMPAVQGWDGNFTYAELHNLATTLAHRLVELGVGSEVMVPICFDKSVWTIVAMLGILRAGGAFVPLNPDEADQRRNEILNQTKARLILTSESHKDISVIPGCSSLVVSRETLSFMEKSGTGKGTQPLSMNDPNSSVYIIFTSGSTGQPKGVILEHTAVATSCTYHGSRFGFSQNTRMLQFSSYTFDASIIEILTTLIHGGCVCVPSEKDRMGDLGAAINAMSVNSTLLTPTVARTLQRDKLTSLTTLIFGGEAVQQSDYDQWDSLPLLINAYGPTECAITSTAGRYDKSTNMPNSIGTPVGCSGWIVDLVNHNKLVPIGAVGELLVEGPNLARGYLNNSEKTAAAFIDNPTWLLKGSSDGLRPGRRARLYKTGDVVRYNHDGSISYVGRKDAQVKLRGQRLELGEVEYQLRACIPSMTQVVADVIEPGEQKSRAVLVAFFTASHNGVDDDTLQVISQVAPGVSTVRVQDHAVERLSSKLPKYMVPTIFLCLNQMPLMASGKTNRKALRQIASSISPQRWAKLQSNGDDEDKRQPQTEVEHRLREIWSRVLNIDAESIGVDSSFFHVGGDSITAMQLSAAIRTSLGDISTSDILQKKTISKLATLLGDSMIPAPTVSASTLQPSTPSDAEQWFQMSPIQQLYTRVESDPTRCFDQHFFLRLGSKISFSALNKALKTIVSRHPILRARYKRTETGEWVQRITNDVKGSIHVCQSGNGHLSISPVEMARMISHDRDLIDVENGPLTIAMLFNNGVSQHLFIATHHLVIDLVSWRILLQELEEMLRFETTTMPPPKIDFQAWTLLQHQYISKSIRSQDATSTLSSKSPITPPSIPMLQYWGIDISENVEGATATDSFSLAQEASEAILGACNHALGTRPVELMIAALMHSFITTFSDREAPATYTEGHGREPWDDTLDISRTIGWFTTMFPVQAQLTGETSLLDTVRKVKDAIRSLPRNGWEHFTSKFVTNDGARENVKEYPLEILFNYAGSYQQLERSDSLFLNATAPSGCEPSSWSELTRFCLFDVFCQTDRSCLKISVTYPKMSAHKARISAWISTYQSTLQQLAEILPSTAPSWTLVDFPLAFHSYDDLADFEHRLLPQLNIVSANDIEDIFSTSAMQQGILVSQGRNPENYRTRLGIEMFTSKDRGGINISRIEQAWRAVVQRHSLLRALFVDNIPGSSDMMQIILTDPEPSIAVLTQEDWEDRDRMKSVTYTSEGLQHHLSIYKLDDERALLDLEINHAIADGYSVYNILLRDMKLAYTDDLDIDRPLYSDFIKYTSKQSSAAALSFWMKQLHGSEPCFISASSSGSTNEINAFTIDLEQINAQQIREFSAEYEVTTATIIQVAWALVLQMHTGQSAPTFGMLTSGRDMPVENVENIFGPLINIIPCRIRLDEHCPITEALQTAQNEYIESFPYQTLPLINIHRGLGVGSSGLFNSAMSFQKNVGNGKPVHDDGLSFQYRHVEDQVEFDVSVAVEDNYNDDGTGEIGVQLLFKAGSANPVNAQSLANAFSSTIAAIVQSNVDTTSANMSLLQPRDESKMRAWNCSEELPSVEECIHHLIQRQTEERPCAPAVCSWDGNLTYQELDTLASRLAAHLIGLGVGPEVVVPLCFEKSMWTVVAWLAVLKAGGAFILLDPSLPAARIGTICRVVHATVAMASPITFSRFSGFVDQIVGLDEALMKTLGKKEEVLAASAQPSPGNAAYIIFTSGSTGEPKGAIIEHRSYCTAALHHGPTMRMSPNTRSLQFGSYNFAGAIMEMLMTLIHGGCTCILSDEQRGPGGKLVKGITDLGANWAFLTSTVLAYMNPEDVPSLKTICVGGEPVRSSQIEQWASTVHLRQTYGSAETSAVVSSAWLKPSSANTHVGTPTTGRYWIVNPRNSDQLLPIGVPGEIIIEGAVIGREYMGNPEKTAAAFINMPAWRVSFGSRNPTTRFYLTGDLGCFKEDGSIELLGRKDTQMKLRGQRMEMGEIEYQIRQATSDVKEAAVELAVIGQASSSGAELVGFLVIDDHELAAKARNTIRTVQARLEEVLPYFMVPSLLVPIPKLPLTVSGKTDRRRLRIAASELTTDQLEKLAMLAQAEAREPSNDTERLMRALWAEVLNIEISRVGMDDSFFRLGGDSVAAMKLVGAARKAGIFMTVADVFRQPSLASQAKEALKTSLELDSTTEVIPPFSLLNVSEVSIEEFRQELASLCGNDTIASAVQDAYSCTQLQQGLLSSTFKESGGDYVLQLVLDISDNLEIDKLKSAWECAVEHTPTLRTRIVQHSQFGLIQVVYNESIQWLYATKDIDDYLQYDRAQMMELGERLFRLAIVEDGERQWMVCTIHHALYDGMALPCIFDSVNAAYRGETISSRTQFNAFISYLGNLDESHSTAYWESYLSGGQFTTFPTLPASVQEASPNMVIEKEIALDHTTTSFTMSTIIRGALAMAISQYTGSADVVFGALVSGRNAPVAGIEEIVGPTIATVPVRVQVNNEQTIHEFLENIHQQATEMLDHEQTGLQRISKINDDTKSACNFQSMLEIVFQGDDAFSMDKEIGVWRPSSDIKKFTNYAFTLDCTLHNDKVVFHASIDTAVIDHDVAESMLEQIGIAMHCLITASPHQKIGDVDTMTTSEKTTIWGWNHTYPEMNKNSLHQIIAERVAESPNSPAVCAWDGDLTYHELDALSTSLACHLQALGVGPSTVVPLFFEKSMWTVVTVMGVLKAGGAFALLDMGLPEARLHAVIEQCGATIVCSSVKNKSLCSLPSTKVQVIGPESIKDWTANEDSTVNGLPDYNSALPMYVCFTSGSTGKPKGIVITHESFATALKYQAKALRFKPESRVFDFASYSFDVAVHNVMTTLAIGGCLCIPSDSDRKNNINGAMASMRVTMVNLTATVARLLKPDMLPDLETLILLGENVNATDLEEPWKKEGLTIINTYGPAECTPISTINLTATSPAEATGIGKGIGVVTWVVDQHDHSRLVPIGVVGELLLEGPVLAQGYLGDPEKTAQAFIKNPEWILQGAGSHAGRESRLYKTGDLVKYNRDGSLAFVGRKDTQVKIRGQRLELGEIEHHVRECALDHGQVQVVADVITPDGDKDRAILAVFIVHSDMSEAQSTTGSTSGSTTDRLSSGFSSAASMLFDSVSSVSDTLELATLNADIGTELSRRLPTYMTPSVYLRVPSFPQSPSGKIDRKRLREIGSSMSAEQLAKMRAANSMGEPPKRKPQTTEAKLLQNLWAQILRIDTENIGLDSNFFLLGGDSVAAIQLVAEARKFERCLTVAEVFRSPVLEVQAELITEHMVTDDTTLVAPFSLLKSSATIDERGLKNDFAALCDVEATMIQDAYPCTPLQEGLISLTAKDNSSYVMQAVLDLSKHVELDAFKEAWTHVVQSTPILRTHIVQHSDLGLVQVVVNRDIEWTETRSLKEYLVSQDNAAPMSLGASLCRFGIVYDGSNGPRHFVWTIHHALYDGGSLPTLMNLVHNAYSARVDGQRLDAQPSPSFNCFVNHVISTDEAEADRYWKSYFSSLESVPFPSLPKSELDSTAFRLLERELELEGVNRNTVTMSSILRGALAILMSRHTASRDVVFGAIVSGRSTPVVGIDDIIGPTIAAVPVRVQLPKNGSVQAYLEAIQKEATQMIDYEQTGLQRIAQISADARVACDFQTLLVVQPQEAELNQNEDALGSWHLLTETSAFTTYAVMLECLLRSSGDGMKLKISFDSNIVSEVRMDAMMKQFCLIVKEIATSKADMSLEDVQATTDEDAVAIWHWNESVPAIEHSCTHELFKDQVLAQPDSPAVCGFDGEYTYAQLDDLSSRLAYRLVEMGILPNTLIPICFEKSTLTIVAMLAINKAQCAFVPFNPADGSQRHGYLIREVKATVVLVSTAVQDKIRDELSASGCTALVVAPDYLAQLPQRNQYSEIIGTLPLPKPDSTAYVLFTSGSTGTPKGVVVKQSSVVTSCLQHGHKFGFSNTSRMLQFSSYTFDASISEIFGTLIFGGCICVPSEQDRLSNLDGAIRSLAVNTVMITPTVSHMLNPETVPALHTLILCGEPAAETDYQKWLALPTLINGYGPTECSIYAVAATYDEVKQNPGCIGKGVGCVTWVVDPLDHNKLAPLGATGELLIEGWTVAEGYLNSMEKTKIAFIDSPAWLQQGFGAQPGRQSRLYKTGDLVRYNDDGTLSFVSRIDNQVKIRGQRLELGEVEYRVRSCLPCADQIVAEVILPENQKNKATLAVFLTVISGFDEDNTNLVASADSIVVDDSELMHVNVHADVDVELSQRLPRYMIPSIYFKLQSMPVSAAGKSDRKRLRQIGSQLTAQQIIDMQKHSQGQAKLQPETSQERCLQGLWAQVLGVEKESIGLDDSFFRLGGDSIAAMKLVGLARASDVLLTVGDVFQHPILSTQAKIMADVDDINDEIVEPFSFVNIDNIEELAISCGLNAASIEDAYPCTPLQEGLLSLTAKRSGNYTLQAVLELSDDVDLAQFMVAWETVVKSNAVLRTRIVQHDSADLLQVVHNTPIQWQRRRDLNKYLEGDRADPMGLGDDLSRFALIESQDSTSTFFVWTVHHTLYDGWSLSAILDSVTNIYMGKRAIAPKTEFNAFVRHIYDNRQSAEKYWREYLEAGNFTIFPGPTSSVNDTVADGTLEVDISLTFGDDAEITTATIIRGALALLMSQYTGGSQDVVFGATVSGRSAPVAHITDIVGPTIATVPIRVQPRREQTVKDYLASIQQQSVEMEAAAHEQIGLQNIAKLNDAGRSACGFQTLLVIQPQDNDFAEQNTLGKWKSSNDSQAFSTYALTLECFMLPTGIKVRSSYDTSTIETWQMELALDRFRDLLHHLTTFTSIDTLQDLVSFPDHESDMLWKWNKSVPESTGVTVDHLINAQVHSHPDAPAINSWDGELTYEQLDTLSSRLAKQLFSLGVGAEVIVPLCFERSMWMVVAMLGVMKAGGAFVVLSYSDAPERHSHVLHETNASLILTSALYSEVALPSNCTSLVVDEESLKGLEISTSHITSYPGSQPGSPAYIIFTSGSTGQPKGVVLEHQAVSTSCRAHGAVYGFDTNTRVLQFSSYTFDACIVEIFTTLVFGGCICIPSEADRLGNLTEVINATDVNTLQITPTVARTLQPRNMPGLECLILCGESVSESDYIQWQNVARIMNGYGPTEAAICSTIQVYNKATTHLDSIGTAVGCVTWILNPEDEGELAPIGSIGELAIEGNTLARGYLNDPVKTAAGFIQDPQWLVQGTSGHQGRTGRLYKTGDLVRYNADGSLSYIGRKDTQAKIRGQRLELGDVEHHVRECAPCTTQVVAEVISPGGEKEKALLAVFIAAKESEQENSFTKPLPVADGIELVNAKSETVDALSQRLPAYMMPTIYFQLASIPLMPSGKANRKYLREMGSSFTSQQLVDLMAQFQTTGKEKRQPQTDAELHLRSLWARVLNIHEDSIGLDDNFFRLGGDSITVMRLVGVARSSGMSLSVSEIFKQPVLVAQARALAVNDTQSATLLTPAIPFELLDSRLREQVITSATELVAPARIEDIYPTTAYQDITIRNSLESKKHGFNYFYFDLGFDVDVENLMESCKAILLQFTSLRSTFVQALGHLWQVVLKDPFLSLQAVRVNESLASAFHDVCRQDSQTGFYLGDLLTGFILINNEFEGYRLVIRLSHGQYDGVSFPIMVKALMDHYQSKPLDPVTEFSVFLKYAKLRRDASSAYWRNLLKGTHPTALQPLDLPGDVNTPAKKVLLENSISLPGQLPGNITLASVTSSAWAVVLSALSGENDIVYGSIVAGRNANFHGIEQTSGPCINIIPIRVQLNQQMTPQDIFSTIQTQQLLLGDADSLGMREIMEHCVSWPNNTRLESVVKHQGIDENYEFEVAGKSVRAGYFDNPDEVPASYLRISTYPLKDGVRVEIMSNTHVISSTKATSLLSCVCKTIALLLTNQDKPLSSFRDRIELDS